MSDVIVVTRPEPDACDYADELRSQGFEVFVEPMLRLEALDFEQPDLAQYDGILLTSANSLDPRLRGEDIEVRVYCVGKHTADVANKHGFQDVISVDGTGVDLLVHVLSIPHAKDQTFLHICGQHLAFPLAEKLNDAGVQTDSLPVYDSIQVDGFSEAFIDLLKNGDVSAVTFFSKRTSEAFVRNVLETDSESLLSGIKALSISGAVLECVRVLPWAENYVSDTPDRAGMLQLLKTYVQD